MATKLQIGEEILVRAKVVAPANEHNRIEIVCDTDEQFWVSPEDVLTSSSFAEQAQLEEAESIRKELAWAAGAKLNSNSRSRAANVLRWLDERIVALRAAKCRERAE